MNAWWKVIGLGLSKIPMKIITLGVVPFLDDEARNDHPIFGVRDATDLSWYNIAWRNGVHNMYNREMPVWKEAASNTKDLTLENEDGFQWRLRVSEDGEYVSFRVSWGKIKPKKGKNEFYVGWVMNEDAEYMRLTFFQLRPAWFILIPIVLVWGVVKIFT